MSLLQDDALKNSKGQVGLPPGLPRGKGSSRRGVVVGGGRKCGFGDIFVFFFKNCLSSHLYKLIGDRLPVEAAAGSVNRVMVM